MLQEKLFFICLLTLLQEIYYARLFLNFSRAESFINICRTFNRALKSWLSTSRSILATLLMSQIDLMLLHEAKLYLRPFR